LFGMALTSVFDMNFLKFTLLNLIKDDDQHCLE